MSSNRSTHTTQYTNKENLKTFSENTTYNLNEETLGTVGPSYKGPAFLPVSLTSYNKNDDLNNTFENVFGTTQENYIKNTKLAKINDASICNKLWFENGNKHSVFTRILGLDGENYSPGFITYGFVFKNELNLNFLDGATTSYSTFRDIFGNYEKVIGGFLFANSNNIVFSNYTAENNTSPLDFHNTTVNKRYNSHEDLYEEKGILVYQNYSLLNRDDKKIWDRSKDHVKVEKLFDFRHSFKTSKTPWVISQCVGKDDNYITDIGNSAVKLFRFHSLDDGEVGNRFKFRITPKIVADISKTNEDIKWSKFDLEIFEFSKSDREYVSLEKFSDLDLNPVSKDFISRRIGDIHTFYDFDSEKVIVEGEFRNNSKYVRVEVNNSIITKSVKNNTLIPVGFLGYPYYVDDESYYLGPMLRGTLLRSSVSDLSENLYWGVSSNAYDISRQNNMLFDVIKTDNNNDIIPHEIYSKFNPYLLDPNEDNPIREEDVFSLEKIVVSDDPKEWWYDFKPDVFDGHIDISEALAPKEDFEPNGNEEYLSFEFFSYGGFDGLNLLNAKEKNLSCSLAEKGNNIYELYKKASEITLDNGNYITDVFLIPGMTNIHFLYEMQNVIYSRDCIYIYDSPLTYTEGDKSDYLYYYNLDTRLIETNDLVVDLESSITNSPLIYDKNIIKTLGRLDCTVDNIKTDVYSSIYVLDKLRFNNYDPLGGIVSSDIFNSSIIEPDSNNNIDRLLDSSRNNNLNIVLSKNNSLRLNSSLLAIDKRSNLLRFLNNRRLLNNIKRDLIYSISSANTFKGEPLLFSIINEGQMLHFNFDNVLSYYKDNNFIEDFNINNNSFTNKSFQSLKLQNAVKISVYLKFKGGPEYDFTELTLNDIINSEDVFTENELFNVVLY
jgi:hypothetical protein